MYIELGPLQELPGTQIKDNRSARDGRIVDCGILKRRNINQIDTGDICNRRILLGTNGHPATGIDPRSVGADEIALRSGGEFV